MIDRGAGSISSAAEPLQGRRSGGKGAFAEIRRRVGADPGWGIAEHAVHCHGLRRGALSLIPHAIAERQAEA